MSDFFQDPPTVRPAFETDRQLRLYLQRLPEEVRTAIEPGLYGLAERAAYGNAGAGRRGRGAAAAARAFRCLGPAGRPHRGQPRPGSSCTRSPPRRASSPPPSSASEGEWSRVHQLLRLYLYHPSSAIASCPMAMTDGAARVLELEGSPDAAPAGAAAAPLARPGARSGPPASG